MATNTLKDILCALGTGGAFVLSMYTYGATDNSRRNEPAVIARRLVTSGCVTMLLGVYPLFAQHVSASSSWRRVVASLSLPNVSDFFSKVLLRRGAVALKLVSTLFAGVLVEWALYFLARAIRRLRASRSQQPKPEEQSHGDEDEDQDEQNEKTSSLLATLMQVFRDFFAAPVTEEMVFRGAVQQTCLSSSPLWRRPSLRVVTSALIFSLAHFHHAIHVSSLNENASSPSLYQRISTLWQRAYVVRPRVAPLLVPPLMFGILGGILVELKVGLLPIAAAHSFCNLVGPPKWPVVVLHDSVVQEELQQLFRDGGSDVANKVLKILFPLMHVACVGLFAREVYRA